MLFVRREVILKDVKGMLSAIVSSSKCLTVYKSKEKLMVTLTICWAGSRPVVCARLPPPHPLLMIFDSLVVTASFMGGLLVTLVLFDIFSTFLINKTIYLSVQMIYNFSRMDINFEP